MMPSDCPSKEVLLLLLADESGLDADDAVETHVADCPRCQKRLDVLTSYPALARIGAANESRLDWTHSRSSAMIRQVAAALADEQTGNNGPERTVSETDDRPDIAGYELLDRIGTGATADVYRAIHRQLRRIVALKISRARARTEDHDRFQREAEALARLRHPGVVQIYETGQAGGRLFMALEYESAGSLSKFLHGEPQSPVDSARFITAAAEAVHAAHQQGLIHRDLKPGNILLRAVNASNPSDGIAAFTPKITDFGLVKMIAEEAALTNTRDVLGTPSYMAPEQVSGTNSAIGPRADVYALGTVLYEMLTGRPPFRAATAIDTIVQVRFDDPVPPSRLTPAVPIDLETICLKCLEKDAAHRYATAADLAEDLTRFVAGRPVLARPARWPKRAWRWMRRNPRVAILAASLLAVLLALAVAGPMIALRQTRLRQEAEDAKVNALKQWDRADQNVKAAGDAIWQSTVFKLAESERSGEPMPPDVQRALINFAIPYLEKAQAGDPEQPVYRQRMGIALYVRGRAAARAGDAEAAIADLTKASTALDRLAADTPGNLEVRIYAGMCQVEFTRLFLSQNDDRANNTAREAVNRFEDIVRSNPDSPAGWDGLALATALMADVLEKTALTRQDALAQLARAVEARATITRLLNGAPGTREMEAELRLRLADYYHRLNRTDNRITELRSALSEANRPTVEPSLELIRLRNRTAERLADALCDASRWDEAAPLAAQAESAMDQLNRLFPDIPANLAILHQCRQTKSRTTARAK